MTSYVILNSNFSFNSTYQIRQPGIYPLPHFPTLSLPRSRRRQPLGFFLPPPLS
jgi:hypothetical protein